VRIRKDIIKKDLIELYNGLITTVYILIACGFVYLDHLFGVLVAPTHSATYFPFTLVPGIIMLLMVCLVLLLGFLIIQHLLTYFDIWIDGAYKPGNDP